MKDKKFSSFTYKIANTHNLRLHVVKAVPSHDVLAIFVHGGGWLYGSSDQFHDQMTYLAEYGISSIAIDYSTLCTNRGDPAVATADVNDAVSFIMQHEATLLGFHPRRVFLAGGSSGGQLAFSVLYKSPFRNRVNGLILYNPVIDVDIPLTRHYFPQLSTTLKFALSPRHHIGAIQIPTLILHGQNDSLIPITEIRKFCQALSPYCGLKEFFNADHGFFNKPPYKATIEALTHAFIEHNMNPIP